MPFQMGFSKTELSGAQPVPDGWYKLQFKNFKPTASKPKNGQPSDSVNLNAEFEVIEPAEYAGRKVFAGLNNKGAWIYPDFVHACGLQMEVIQDGNQGTKAEQQTIPGVFDGADKFPEDPSQWKYLGPLTNRIFEAEVAVTKSEGYKPKNEIRQYKCSVPGCEERHSTNLIKKSS